MGDELKCFFSLRGDTPMISVLFYIVGGEEDEQVDHLLAILPPANSFIGVPLATRLSNSNIVKDIMVCF
jgi:hypothetical protein